MSLFSRTDKSFLGRWWWTVDRSLLAMFGVLMIVGVILVATASPPVAETIGVEHYHFLKRHIVFLVPTAFLLFGTSVLDRRTIWRLSSAICFFAIIAMVIVLFTGAEVKGARRWIHIFGFSLQPSEFIKPAFIVVSAWFMAMQKKKQDFPGNSVAAAVYFSVMCLLLLQPDLGMAFVVTCSWGVQIFLAGFPLRLLIILGCAAITGLIGAYFSFDHFHSRIDRFLHPEAGDNFQVEKSLEAFREGGLLGTGPGQGSVKFHLPDAHADFIFSVAGEEMGLIFIVLLILIYGLIVFRGFNRLMSKDDMFAVFAAGGLLAMFGLQAFINMGSSLNILPTKGMTLPFVSYGGSSLLSMGYAMGAVLALTRREPLSFQRRSDRKAT